MQGYLWLLTPPPPPVFHQAVRRREACLCVCVRPSMHVCVHVCFSLCWKLTLIQSYYIDSHQACRVSNIPLKQGWLEVVGQKKNISVHNAEPCFSGEGHHPSTCHSTSICVIKAACTSVIKDCCYTSTLRASSGAKLITSGHQELYNVHKHTCVCTHTRSHTHRRHWNTPSDGKPAVQYLWRS